MPQTSLDKFVKKRKRNETEEEDKGSESTKKQRVTSPDEDDADVSDPEKNQKDAPASPKTTDHAEFNITSFSQIKQYTSQVDPKWKKFLEAEFQKPYFNKLLASLAEEEREGITVYPPPSEVLSIFKYSTFDEVKVIILGQDPYHQPGQAHGCAFSVKKGVKIPRSLNNIYKELETDIPEFKKPAHGSLEGWARQGVFLLNTVLTVRDSKANSHRKKGWKEFTLAALKYLDDHKKGLVFMLWGKPAQKVGSFIDRKKHHVLECAHPSPLAAHKGFFGCKHFSKCNELLKKDGKKPIDWSYLP